MKRESWNVADKAAWAARDGRDVTGSTVAALFGCHLTMSGERLRQLIRGAWRPFNSRAMIEGRRLERAFPAALALQRPDWRLERCRDYWRLPEHRLGAIADFWLNDDGVIEAKTVQSSRWASWGCQPPLAFALQTACELLCSDRPHGVLAVMLRDQPDQPLRLFNIPRIGEVDERLLAAVCAWWAAFDEGELAPASDARGLAELLLPEIAPKPRRAYGTSFPRLHPPALPSLPLAATAAARGALAAGQQILTVTHQRPHASAD